MTIQPTLPTFSPIEIQSDEWYTPAKYIALVREVIGNITTDPASCEFAQRTVQAKTYYTLQTNGLAQSWHGAVFVNPPYSRGVIGQCSAKFVAEYEIGNMQRGIILVNSDTSTKWMQSLLVRYPVCFTAGRIRFVKRDNKFNGAGRYPQAFFYAGDNAQRFSKIFSQIGTVMSRVE